MNTAAKIVTSVWAKRLSKSLEQQLGFEGLQEGSGLTDPHGDRFYAFLRVAGRRTKPRNDLYHFSGFRELLSHNLLACPLLAPPKIRYKRNQCASLGVLL